MVHDIEFQEILYIRRSLGSIHQAFGRLIHGFHPPERRTPVDRDGERPELMSATEPLEAYCSFLMLRGAGSFEI
jgi:hypothetical protein